MTEEDTFNWIQMIIFSQILDVSLYFFVIFSISLEDEKYVALNRLIVTFEV